MFLLSRSKSEYGDCTLEQVIIMQERLYCGLEGQLKRSREWKSLLSRKEMSVIGGKKQVLYHRLEGNFSRKEAQSTVSNEHMLQAMFLWSPTPMRPKAERGHILK